MTHMITQGTRPSKAKSSSCLYGTNPQTNKQRLDTFLARLTRQNLQTCMYNTLRYKSIILLVSVQYMYRR